MNKQINPQPSGPTQSSKHILVTIIAVIITAVVVGGGIYAWQRSILKSTEQNLQRQISVLQSQIDQLPQKKDLNETTSPSPSLPSSCVDQLHGSAQLKGSPVITALSVYSGTVGTKIEIQGCNFAGFEGDKNAWIENAQGQKGLLYGETGSTAKSLKITLKSPLCQKDTSYSGLPCDTWLTLTPGAYKIYTAPWGKESNKVEFTIY